jgi:hypothetical protein
MPDAQECERSLWRHPEDTVCSRNPGWDNGQFIVDGNSAGNSALDKFAQIVDNLENSDPLFRNETAGDYRLSPDSPACDILGFVDIPFPQMGIIDGLWLIFEDGFEWAGTSRWDETSDPKTRQPDLLGTSRQRSRNGCTPTPDWMAPAKVVASTDDIPEQGGGECMNMNAMCGAGIISVKI